MTGRWCCGTIAVAPTRLATVVTLLAFAMGVNAGAARAALPQQSGRVDLLSQANVQIDGADVGSETGAVVAGAGDVNGDGIADVIIGARLASNNSRFASGSAYVVFGQANPTRIDLNNLGSGGFRIDGAATADLAGDSVAGAGDVNGDGLADLIVGAEGAGNNSRFASGSAYVVFGKASTSTVDLSSLGEQGFRIDGATSGDEAGISVAGAGDVNGDGYPDVIVGAFNAGNNARPASGSAYVVFGTVSTSTVDLAALGGQGFRIDGGNAGDEAGTSVAGAGDMNGDGRSDVIVGAPQASNSSLHFSGSAYVVFGQANPTPIDLDHLGSRGFRIDGAGAGDEAGFSVAKAGDVNGDGVSDVIVGAETASNNNRALSGSAYVVFGKASTSGVALSALGAQGFRVDGAAVGDEAGFSVAGAGDVNGDGRPDVIVGAFFADNNSRTSSGSDYVVFGKASTTTVDLGALRGQGFRVDGAAASDFVGGSVAGAGDVNGDGRPDLIVGAEGADNNGRLNSGSAYVLYGFGTPTVAYPTSIAATVGHAIVPLPAAVKRTGAASFAVSPPLPAGLSLDPSSGEVSGTPTAAQAPTVHTITMTDLAGTASATLEVTVNSGPSPGSPPRSGPTISGLRETNRIFAVGGAATALTGWTATARTKRGTVFSFGLDQPATVTIAIRATAPGRRSCRPRGTHRCTSTITSATLTRSEQAGRNQVPFSGRIRRRPLKPGHYEATFTATNSAGSASAPALRFTVVKAHRPAAFPVSARGAVSAALGRGDQRYRATGLRARNPAQRFDATFSRDGVTIAAGHTSTRMELVAFGRESAVRGLARVSPRVSANRVEYARAGVDEWWANGPLGLEQGFDIGARPATGRGPLTLSIALSGNLKPRRDAARLVLEGAGRSLSYGGLIATDARGRTLRSWLELSGRRLLVRVDDRGARYPLRVDPFIQQAELGVSDGAADDALGLAVAASGDTLVAGAPGRSSGTGVAYVFRRPASGWATAAPVAELRASDGVGNDAFGTSVGISGDTIVVGAPNRPVGLQGSEGAVYVFVKPGSGWANARETAELTGDDTSGLDNLGISVAISGDTIVAGDWDHKVGSNFAQGAAYVFVKPVTGWANATETATLTASDGAANDIFGYDVAISGDTVLVGAPGHRVGQNSREGAAYLFVSQDPGWTNVSDAILTPTDGGADDVFGLRVAIAGDTAVVGSPFHRVGLSNQGAAYVFVKPFRGWFNSGQTAELTASDGITNDMFGGSVAISGDTILVGAPTRQIGANQAQGAAYLFAKPPSGWVNGTQGAVVSSSDGGAGDLLGEAVAMSGSTVFAGAPLRTRRLGQDTGRRVCVRWRAGHWNRQPGERCHLHARPVGNRVVLVYVHAWRGDHLLRRSCRQRHVDRHEHSRRPYLHRDRDRQHW
jgi:hypothetical protein